MEVEIEIYQTVLGRRPFEEWFDRIQELHTRAKVLTRIDRLRLGNFGDCKSVGNGVSELRIHYGPGVRIYYTKVGLNIVLLLCGGIKGSQGKDIEKAKVLAKEFRSRGEGHERK